MKQEPESKPNTWFSGPEAAALFLKLYEQLKSESDRGSVIVAAALVDESLEQLIKARLAPSNGRDDELFDTPYAPLSSLSAKIDFAYRAGVIRAQLKSTLHLLRRLRNDFAHSSGTLDFSSHKVQSRIREIFKLNSAILDSVFESVQDKLQSIENENIRATFAKATDKHSSIEKLLELLDWRSLFDMFTAMSCAVLIRLPTQVDPIPALETLD